MLWETSENQIDRPEKKVDNFFFNSPPRENPRSAPAFIGSFFCRKSLKISSRSILIFREFFMLNSNSVATRKAFTLSKNESADGAKKNRGLFKISS